MRTARSLTSGEYLCVFISSILSKGGASEKPGAVQCGLPVPMLRGCTMARLAEPWSVWEHCSAGYLPDRRDSWRCRHRSLRSICWSDRSGSAEACGCPSGCSVFPICRIGNAGGRLTSYVIGFCFF